MSGLELEIEAIVRRVVDERLAAASKPTVEHVTVADYARCHSVSTSTVRAAIREGRLEAIRIGRAVRVAANANLGKPVRRAGFDATKRAQLKLLGDGKVR